MDLAFGHWFKLVEAARRSLGHSLSKFKPKASKPAAVLTAFRGGRDRKTNRRANEGLEKDLRQARLGFYLVHGVGQEEHKALFGLVRWEVPSSEESYIVQPRGEMTEAEFEQAVLALVRKYEQYAALVKLPSVPRSFLLKANAEREYQGSEAGPRSEDEPYFTQLRGGPRAEPDMLSGWEAEGEQGPIKRSINWLAGRPEMNEPADRSKIGRRFSIRRGGEK